MISMWLMSKESMAGVDEQGNKTAEYEPDVEAMPPRPDISFYASARAEACLALYLPWTLLGRAYDHPSAP